jgi:hypothetical protein
MRRTLAAVTAATMTAGCATYSDKVAPSYNSPVRLIRKTILLLPLLLTACAVAKPTYLPDGRQGISIACDGQVQGMNSCFEKAGELCGAKGYDIVNREQQSSPTGGASFNRYGGWASSGSVENRSILIACKQ